MLTNTSLLYYELIGVYKKEHNQVFESKNEDWMKKHDHKNLKDLNYQADKAGKDGKEEGETDQKLPPWIKSKDEFNELKNHILSVKDKSLKTGTHKYQYDFSYMKELIKNIAKKRITKNDPINSLTVI